MLEEQQELYRGDAGGILAFSARGGDGMKERRAREGEHFTSIHTLVCAEFVSSNNEIYSEPCHTATGA